MAAQAANGTAGTRRDYTLGNLRAVQVTMSSVADGDTWQPGLRIVESVTFMTNNQSAVTMSATPNSTGAAITLNVTGGPATNPVVTAFGF